MNKQRERLLIITRGPKPILLASSDGTAKEFPLNPNLHGKCSSEEKIARHAVIDTNGAGDAFVGGRRNIVLFNLNLKKKINLN